jgi:acetylornithine deacetylase/succinyl-diaminopimelate desuccinylase-like protein
MSERQAVQDYIRQNRQRFQEELFEFLRIPSVSAVAESRADTRRAAEWFAGRL